MADVFADLGLWFSVEPPDDRASVRAGLDALMAQKAATLIPLAEETGLILPIGE